MSKTFVIDRDNALLSLDEQKIRSFCRKYNLSTPDNPVVFWASVYKSVLAMEKCPENIRRKAEYWLDIHGFQRGIITDYTEPEAEESEKFPRHFFEHVILPTEFYKWGERFLNQVIDGDRYYMADLYSHVEYDGHAIKPYKANFFKVIRKNYEDESGHITIVRLDLPKPLHFTECRRIYLCRNNNTNDQMYFTSELSLEGAYFLCAWTKRHSHLLLDLKPNVNEYDHVAELFMKLAGSEPNIPEAV